MGPKKKNKKGSHTIPEVHPHILKRREAERIKAEKKFARSLKKIKKGRKRTNTTTLSSNSEASFPEIIPCETSDEESDLQGSPHSACREPIASLTGEQKVLQKTDGNSVIKKTGKDRIESQSDVPKMSENITGRQLFRKNVVETDKGSSKYSPMKSLDDKKLREHTVRTQMANRNKESVEETKGKETLKSERPIKTTDCFDDFPKEFSEARKKLTENLLKKKNELQLKLQAFESERKHLDEQRNKLLSKKRVTFKDPDLAIIGDIKLRTSNEPGKKAKTLDTYSYYDKNKRVLHIGDEHVQIAILINQGSQIICKSRRRPLINSNQDNVESDWQMLKSETKSDKEIVSDSEDQEKSRSDTKFTTNDISEFPSEKYQALENQAISKSYGDIIPDKTKYEMTTETKCTTDIVGEFARYEYQIQDQAISKSDGDGIPHKKQEDKIITETKFSPNRARKASEENSGLSSVQESVKTICENFLKDFISACEQFESRLRNLIKEEQNLKK